MTTLQGYPASWYAATALAGPALPALRETLRADVVIIGAGFTGLSAALHLAQRGVKVVVLEAQRVGWGASGRNGGQIHSGQRRDQLYLEAALGLDDARKLWDLAQEAKTLLRDLIDRHAIACDLTDGLIIADHKPRYVAKTNAYARHLRDIYGYDQVEPLDRGQLRALVGSESYYGGLIDHGAGHLHPLNFALGLARAALEAGAVIHEHSPAVRVVEGRGVSLFTAAGGRVDADLLLLCGNGLMDGLDARVDSHIMPINNYIAATAPLGPRAVQIISNGAAVADSRFVVNYFRLTRDGRLLFGGGETYRRTLHGDVKRLMRPVILRTFPQLADVPLDYGWGGTLGITLSRLPFVRRLSSKVLVSAGYSGQGVLLAPLYGKILADTVTHQVGRLDLLERLPVPGFPGGAALRHPLMVAGLTYYALRDRL